MGWNWANGNDRRCLCKCYILSRGDPGIRELLGLKFCFITIVPLRDLILGSFVTAVSVIGISCLSPLRNLSKRHSPGPLSLPRGSPDQCEPAVWLQPWLSTRGRWGRTLPWVLVPSIWRTRQQTGAQEVSGHSLMRAHYITEVVFIGRCRSCSASVTSVIPDTLFLKNN